jgi:phospholipid transport system substrate-binding protein
MIRRHFIHFALALLALIAACPVIARAQSGPASRYLEARHQEVKRLMARRVRSDAERERNRAEMTRVISSLLDFESVSRNALGRHWEERSAAERQEFVALLRTLVERSYQSQLETTQAYEVRYESEASRGDVTVVATVARSTENRRAPEVTIEYHMRRVGEGWVVEDVITDGVSMVRNYRGQFDRIVRRDGWAGLIQRMRDRANEDAG